MGWVVNLEEMKLAEVCLPHPPAHTPMSFTSAPPDYHEFNIFWWISSSKDFSIYAACLLIFQRGEEEMDLSKLGALFPKPVASPANGPSIGQVEYHWIFCLKLSV